MNICTVCNKEYQKTRNVQFFCSRTCYYNSRRGIVLPKSGVYRSCKLCRAEFYIYPGYLIRPRNRTNEYCSKTCSNKSRTGVKKTQEFKNNCKKSSFWIGKQLSEEHKQKISTTRKSLVADGIIKIIKGKRHPNWKGGKNRINKRIRNLKSSKDWRKSVFERDNYTCQECGIRSGNGKAVQLQADHIKPFALYPKLRRTLKNGRTLCVDCHRKTDTYGRKKMYM